MKIKTNNIEFISFSDGICNIYMIDDDGNEVDKHKNLGYSNRIMGYKRFFAAAASQMEINKVISIPFLSDVDTYDQVKIGDIPYDIKLIQPKDDTNPLSMDLTLQLT